MTTMTTMIMTMTKLTIINFWYLTFIASFGIILLDTIIQYKEMKNEDRREEKIIY